MHHPREVLFGGQARRPALALVDHYCGTEARLAKALALQAKKAQAGLGSAPRALFDVTADCEDGAPVGSEAQHARMVAAAINSAANRSNRLGIRVHPYHSPHFAGDLDLIFAEAGARLAYVTVPKVESLAECVAAIAAIDAAGTAHVGRRPAPVPVHVLIESPHALREVDAIAAHPRVECLSFGLMDFVSAFDGSIPDSAMTSPGQFENPLVGAAKVAISLAAHSHGKIASHNVSIVLDDPFLVMTEARRAATQFGFTRMWSIHPGQIDPILAGLAPDSAQLEESAEILLSALAQDWGPTRIQNRLHDRASYRYHWSRLERANTAGLAIPGAALHAFFSTEPLPS